jgi:hypothetical protein
MSTPLPDILSESNNAGEADKKGPHGLTSIPKYGRKLLDIGGTRSMFLRKKKQRT